MPVLGCKFRHVSTRPNPAPEDRALANHRSWFKSLGTQPQSKSNEGGRRASPPWRHAIYTR